MSAKTVTVGRADDNTVVLSRPQVSKHHLEMKQKGETVTVRDLGSLNGSFVNGVRLREGERVLLRGDKVTVDTVELPWETWFELPRRDSAGRMRAAHGQQVIRHVDAMRVERDEVRRRVEAKLAGLKEKIKNK